MSNPANDEILTSLTLDSRAWIKHWIPEINENQMKLLLRYMDGLKIKEVDDFADYLSDIDDPEELEMAAGEYSYHRIRKIHAEGAPDDKG